MNKIILIFFIYIFQLSNLSSNEIKLEEVIKGLKSPWSLSFVTDVDILVTEKSGNIFKINLINKRKDKFSHNLNVLEDRQGGLLEILYKNKEIFVSYSENRGNGKSSTSVAKALIKKKKFKFQEYF